MNLRRFFLGDRSQEEVSDAPPLPEMTRPDPVRKAEWAGLGFVLLLFAFTHLQGISEAFLVGHQGFNNSLRSIIGRNYVRYGFFSLRGRPIKNIGPVESFEDHVVHWHHPPLVHMLVGVSFRMFGESEAATRAVPIFFSFLSTIFLWLITRRKLGATGGLLASGVFVLLPLQVEYGKMANYEPLVIAFMLGALLCFLRYREKRDRISLVALYLLTAAAAFTDWPAFILAGFLGIWFVVQKPRQWIHFFAYAVFCTVLLALIWIWLNQFAEHDDGLFGLARWRAGAGSIQVEWGKWFHRFRGRLGENFGTPVLVLSSLGLAWSALNRKTTLVPWVFGAGGFLYILFFRFGSWVHVFFLHYMVPAFAVATAAGFVALQRETPVLLKRLSGFFQSRFPRVGAESAWALSPGVFRGASWVLISGLALWAVTNNWHLLNDAKLRSHGIPVKGGSRRAGLPYEGRLDVVILAKTARRMSRFRDPIAVHRRTNSSPQFRYYLARDTRVISSSSRLRDERLYIVPERVLSMGEKKMFIEKYRVVSLLRYWIVDLKSGKPGIVHMEFIPLPATWRDAFFQSMLYPPHVLSRNRPEMPEPTEDPEMKPVF